MGSGADKSCEDCVTKCSLRNFGIPCEKYTEYNAVSHPKHYTGHPSGVECIQITEHMGFNLGNAVKYIWRCDLKKDAIEDLEKAKWYIDRELLKRRGKTNVTTEVRSGHTQVDS